MRCHTVKSLALLLAAIIGCLLCACSNSEGLDYANHAEEIAAVNEVSSDSNIPKVQETSFSSKELDNLPLDDSEYPYAGIPRIVIETENHQKIKDRETEIPAKLQIWGEKAPESEVMDLTIRGRGNTSWGMPKKSYKIEFVNKQTMLGMPKDRDWALISNYADKTLMKNYLMYHLSAKLGAYYAPRCEFAEIFLNGEYLGVYLLTETIKIAKKRVNLPETRNSYIVEFDDKYRNTEQIVTSKILQNDSNGKTFRIHAPKKAEPENLSTIKNFIEDFETFLKTIHSKKQNNISRWIDINEFVTHYWIQELTKNPDAAAYSSVYFSWEKDGVIKMGPIWDFDLAFGNHTKESINTTDNWYIKTSYWHSYIFNDSIAEFSRFNFWKDNRNNIINVLNEADSIYTLLQYAANNNFKRWNILKSTTYLFHRHSYNTYKEAVDSLNLWLLNRILWIDSEINRIHE